MEDASFSPWSELPPDLVGSVVTRLPTAVDCARFRAVCRSWQSAMRNHGSPARQPPPWVVLPDGYFVSYFRSPSVRSHRPSSFPKNARCIGSSGSWLFVHCIDATKKYTCLLHNPFTHTTVPIPELDTIIEDVRECSVVTKVLMRSGPDDVVTLMTNDRWNYPIMLARAGKGVWFPEAQNAFFARIIDIVFLGGKLYGITKAEDLYFLDVNFDDEGVPMVSTARCIIGHPASEFDEASDVDDDEDDEETNDVEGDEVLEGIADVDEEDELLEGSADVDEEDEVLEGIADVDEDDGLSEHFDYFDDGGLGVVFQDFDYAEDADGTEIHIIRYFVESCGKLFMVKQEAQYLGYKLDFTRKVEVFEADIVARAWVPMIGGLGGHALLLSKPISKFIPACGEIEEDAVYFMDTVNVFSMRSQTNSEAQWNYDNLMSLMLCSDLEQPTWIFPPVLVV